MLSRKMGKQHISRLVLYHQQRKPPKVMVPLAWRQMYLAGGGLNKYVFIQQHRTTKIKISKLFNYCRCNVNISMFDRSHHQCHPAPRPRRHREVSWSHDWCCLGNWKNGRAGEMPRPRTAQIIYSRWPQPLPAFTPPYKRKYQEKKGILKRNGSKM